MPQIKQNSGFFRSLFSRALIQSNKHVAEHSLDKSV